MESPKMKLRGLKIEDAEHMLSWMKDDFVTHDLKTNFREKTLEDCIAFIQNSYKNEVNWHLAIVDENDIYMGTVSLKEINAFKQCAEFAITVKRNAMGKGYAKYAINSMFALGFKKMNLDKIYWSVSPENQRAIRFYDKNGFQQFPIVEDKELYEQVIASGYSEEEVYTYLWYLVKNPKRKI